jgi:uncharacterized membrane protein HdeD (DUF308 family)
MGRLIRSQFRPVPVISFGAKHAQHGQALPCIECALLSPIWPGRYGAYALVDGACALIGVFTGRARTAPTWWLIIVGICGIAAGLIAFFYPGLTAIVLVLLIGAWAIVHGVFEIIGAIQLRKEIQNEWMLILAGAISVIFGVIIMAAPGAGALGLVWAIAAYSIVFGAMLVGFAFRLRQHRAA